MRDEKEKAYCSKKNYEFSNMLETITGGLSSELISERGRVEREREVEVEGGRDRRGKEKKNVESEEFRLGKYIRRGSFTPSPSHDRWHRGWKFEDLKWFRLLNLAHKN
jgi:hypothetical protein